MAASDHVIQAGNLQDDESSTSHTVASLVATDDMSDDSDQSKRVILPANCVVILNGQKCQLRINEESGALVAYPIKDDTEEVEASAPPNLIYNDRADVTQTIVETSVHREDINEPVTHTHDTEIQHLQQSSKHLQHTVGMEELVIENVHGHAVSILNDQGMVEDLDQGNFIVTTRGIESMPDDATEVLHMEDHLVELSTSETAEPPVKLAVPKLIIPSVGGNITSLAINQHRVTGVTKVNDATVAINETDDTTDDMMDSKLTVTNMQTLKPVLKQFLISPDSATAAGNGGAIGGGDDLVSLGIKTSGSDLEKLRCENCQFQAYYPQQYEKHLRDKHSTELHSCKCCTFVCLAEMELIKHYTDIHPRNICEICHHVSEHAYIIKRHMYRHTSEGCNCEICGKVYKDQYILKMHRKMVHTPAEVLYQCDVCNKKFTRKAHLKRHYRTHNPEKAFACPKCDYRGCERSDVTKHMLIHETPKLVCDVCGKSFRHQKNKALHMKRHAGQRDFKCGVCDFFGYTFTDIRKHIERRHTEWKAVVCEKCGHAFKSEHNLQEHMNRWHNAGGPSASTSSSVAASGENTDGGVIVVSTTSGQPSHPCDGTLILSADGTMLSEEQVIAMNSEDHGGEHTEDEDDDNVIEFIATGIEGSSSEVLGQEHFTTIVTSEQEHFTTCVTSSNAATSLT